MLVIAIIVAMVFMFTSCGQKSNSAKKNVIKEEIGSSKSTSKLGASTSRTNSNWMSYLSDNKNLTELSIPGTHDSGARYDPPVWGTSDTAKCQTLSIAEQLDAGVRYLDIRCRHKDNIFYIHHGMVYQKINFDNVLNDCIKFLSKNPNEVIIMCVNEEHKPEKNTRSFEETFNNYARNNQTAAYTNSPNFWYLGNITPKLGQVRGKIVLMRRFEAKYTPLGIDVSKWSSNYIDNKDAKIKIQDKCEVSNTNDKWTNIETLLNEAVSNKDPKCLYVNCTSGYKTNVTQKYEISPVSKVINPKVDNYFTTHKKGRFGIIAMNFATSDSCKKVIDTNF